MNAPLRPFKRSDTHLWTTKSVPSIFRSIESENYELERNLEIMEHTNFNRVQLGAHASFGGNTTTKGTAVIGAHGGVTIVTWFDYSNLILYFTLTLIASGTRFWCTTASAIFLVTSGRAAVTEEETIIAPVTQITFVLKRNGFNLRCCLSGCRRRWCWSFRLSCRCCSNSYRLRCGRFLDLVRVSFLKLYKPLLATVELVVSSVIFWAEVKALVTWLTSLFHNLWFDLYHVFPVAMSTKVNFILLYLPFSLKTC